MKRQPGGKYSKYWPKHLYIVGLSDSILLARAASRCSIRLRKVVNAHTYHLVAKILRYMHESIIDIYKE